MKIKSIFLTILIFSIVNASSDIEKNWNGFDDFFLENKELDQQKKFEWADEPLNDDCDQIVTEKEEQPKSSYDDYFQNFVKKNDVKTIKQRDGYTLPDRLKLAYAEIGLIRENFLAIHEKLNTIQDEFSSFQWIAFNDIALSNENILLSVDTENMKIPELKNIEYFDKKFGKKRLNKALLGKYLSKAQNFLKNRKEEFQEINRTVETTFDYINEMQLIINHFKDQNIKIPDTQLLFLKDEHMGNMDIPKLLAKKYKKIRSRDQFHINPNIKNINSGLVSINYSINFCKKRHALFMKISELIWENLREFEKNIDCSCFVEENTECDCFAKKEEKKITIQKRKLKRKI